MNTKFFLTQAKYDALIREVSYLEGEGNQILAKLLASSPGSGMGRPNDLPIHILAGEIMGYLQEIKAILKNTVIIDNIRERESDINKVIVGTTVSITYSDDDEVVEYTILGQKEVDLDLGRISCLSPIGAGLLGHRIGDEFTIDLGTNNRMLLIKIIKIERKSLAFEYGESLWRERLEQSRTNP